MTRTKAEQCACAPHLTPDGKTACVRHKIDGTPCPVRPMVGVSVCFIHGKAPSIRRRVGAIKALQRLRVPNAEQIANPLEALRDLAVEIDGWREQMAHKAARLLENDDLVYLDDAHRENVRAAVTLYERAVDRSVKALEALAKLNIDERLMRIEAAKVAFVVEAIEAALEDAGCDITTRERVRESIGRRLSGTAGRSLGPAPHQA